MSLANIKRSTYFGVLAQLFPHTVKIYYFLEVVSVITLICFLKNQLKGFDDKKYHKHSIRIFKICTSLKKILFHLRAT